MATRTTAPLDDTTFIITAYQRPNKLGKLLASLAEFFPGVQVVIADVSDEPLSLGGLPPCVRVVRHAGEETPEGHPTRGNLSAGRNLALANVTTTYFVLLDDDYFFTEAKSIRRMRRFILNSDFDIIGGCCHNTSGTITDWTGRLEFEGDTLRMFRQETKSTVPTKTDVVVNFFIASTWKVRKMGGWTEEIPICGEHIDFFIKAKLASINVGYFPEGFVMHDSGGDTPQNAEAYNKMRLRRFHLRKVLDRWNLRRFIPPEDRIHCIDDVGKLDFIENPQRVSRGIIILATGRSGSSCVGQILHTLGVHMGDYPSAPPRGQEQINPDGYFEDLGLLHISARFTRSGPTKENIEELFSYIHGQKTRHQLWGMKQPRLFCDYGDVVKKEGWARRQWLGFLWAYRDVDDCVASYLRTPWQDDEGVARKIMEKRHAQISKLFDTIAADNRLKVDYARLMADPYTEVEAIAEWVGVTDDALIDAAIQTVRSPALI